MGRKNNVHKNKMKRSKEERIYQICITVLVLLVLLACILPLLYVVGMSLTSEGEMMERNYFVIIPRKPILSAYRHILGQSDFYHGMLITVIRTVLGVGAALVLTIPAGYVLAKEDLPARKGIMVFFIITMILNGGLIPSYLLMTKLKLVNSFWVYIVPAFANTYGILVVKMFVEGMPKELMESADLDGAGELQKMIHLAIPLLKPTICALGLFAAVGHWNDWFTTMVYIKDRDLYPVQYIIRNMLIQSSTGDMMNNINSYMKMTTQSVKMASVIIAILPVLCIYPFLQKYFVHGMYTGSVKG